MGHVDWQVPRERRFGAMESLQSHDEGEEVRFLVDVEIDLLQYGIFVSSRFY